jgi:hypothetical protein
MDASEIGANVRNGLDYVEISPQSEGVRLTTPPSPHLGQPRTSKIQATHDTECLKLVFPDALAHDFNSSYFD